MLPPDRSNHRLHRPSRAARPFAALAAAALSAPMPAAAGDGLDLLSKLPAGLSAVVGVDMGRARKSPLHASWQKSLKTDPRRAKEYAEFVRRVGFDPATEVESVVLAASLGNTDKVAFVAIAKGAFDAAKAYKALQVDTQGRKPVERTHAGVKYLVAGEGGRDIAVALTKGLAFVGTEADVKAALDLHGGKARDARSAADDGRLAGLARRAAAGSDAWIALVLPDTLQPNPAMGAAGALATAREVFGTVRIADGLDVSITSICPDEGIAAGLQQALTMAAVGLQRNPAVAQTGVGPMLSRLRTTLAGRELVTHLRLDAAEFNRLLDNVARTVDRSRAGPAAGPTRPGPAAAVPATAGPARAPARQKARGKKE